MLNIKYDIIPTLYLPFHDPHRFCREKPLSFMLLRFKYIVLFSNSSFVPVFQPNPYTRMCVSTLGSFATLGKQVKTYDKSKVESGFVGFSVENISLEI